MNLSIFHLMKNITISYVSNDKHIQTISNTKVNANFMIIIWYIVFQVYKEI